MDATDRWRVVIFAGLLVGAAGLAGLIVWWGAPHLANLRNGLRWQREMREVVAKRAQIEAEWSRQFGPLEDFPKRHPATDDNETARKLDAELLGMGMRGIINPNKPRSLAELEEAIQPGSTPIPQATQADPQVSASKRAEDERARQQSAQAELVTDYLNAQSSRR